MRAHNLLKLCCLLFVWAGFCILLIDNPNQLGAVFYQRCRKAYRHQCPFITGLGKAIWCVEATPYGYQYPFL